MKNVRITAGTRTWRARIADTIAGRAFLEQLPLTLRMKDYASTEVIADLPRALSREGAPASITPRAGDVTFYAPWGNLAIFHRDGHRSPGLLPLGRVDGDPAGLAALAGKDVTFEAVAG